MLFFYSGENGGFFLFYENRESRSHDGKWGTCKSLH